MEEDCTGSQGSEKTVVPEEEEEEEEETEEEEKEKEEEEQETIHPKIYHGLLQFSRQKP
jgi:hypothetical protein